MSSAIRSTLAMAVMAVVALAIAAYYYPWPEIKDNNALVGSNLFEEYKTTQVRGIKIIQFNRQRGVLERIELQRDGEKWIIPAKENFIASNAGRISVTVNSLRGRQVFEVMSDEEQDHLDYGVVDPDDYGNVKNLSALGTKLILIDRQKKEIASLIIGLPIKNDREKIKRFVRIPGQPNVYVIDYSADVLSTAFSAWVSPNLLQLDVRNDGTGQKIDELEVDNYRLEFKDDAPPTKSLIYRAAMKPKAGQLNIELDVPVEGKPGETKTVAVTPQQQAVLQSIISQGYIVNMISNDVAAKNPKVAAALKDPKEDAGQDVFADMPARGFVKTGFANGTYTFDSAAGALRVITPDAVGMDVDFGSVAGAVVGGGGKLNRYVMIHSYVDYENHPKPARPDGVQEQDDSDENKAYLREVEQWNQKIKAAQLTVNGLNAIHAPWYYLISEDIINGLRPELSITKAQPPSGSPQDSPPQNAPPRQSSPPDDASDGNNAAGS